MKALIALITAIAFHAIVSSSAAKTPQSFDRHDGLIARFRPGTGANHLLSRSGGKSGLKPLDSFNAATLRSPMRRLGPAKFASPDKAAESGLGNIFYMDIAPGKDADEIIAEYMAMGYFEYIEPNYFCAPHALDTVHPDDRYFYRQWGMHNNGTFNYNDTAVYTAGADADMTKAWGIEQGDSSIILAIIDSGCKMTHAEFRGRFWRNGDEIARNGKDDDNNGYIDDTLGWDFVDEDPYPEDTLGHGTAVAGVAAANGNNEIGYAGVDWECKLMILKVIQANPEGLEGAAFDDLYEAIIYAADNGADVINLSLGSRFRSRAVESALSYARNKGCVIVASAGNQNDSPISFPARYSAVIAVGSSDPDDTRTIAFLGFSEESGSNYGNGLNVIAPGNYIYYLILDNDTTMGHVSGGTSFAAPAVSGLATLLLAKDATRSVTQVQQIIEETAEDEVGDPSEDVSGWDQYYGHGRVNGFAALTYGETGTASLAIAASAQKMQMRLSAGRLIVTVPGSNYSGEVSVSLYNSQGKLLYSGKQTLQESKSISFAANSNAARQLYFIRIQAGNRLYSDRIMLAR